VRFGNFLFPDCRDPARDSAVIDETLAEARLSDELGIDVIWLAEHHFDGICAYVDPISFAAALATATRRSTIGFAVIQTSLHHPIRLAEQLALIDNLTKGRLIVGLGRGTAYNIYDYQGFRVDHPQGLEWRRLYPSGPVLAAQGAEFAAAPLHGPASADHPRRLGRSFAGRAGAPGTAVSDERPVARGDPAPRRALSRCHARRRVRRGRDRPQP